MSNTRDTDGGAKVERPDEANNKRFEKFTSLILRINRSVQRIKSEEMSAFGLKCIHVNCLFYLRLNPDGLSQAELGRLCGEDKAYMSRAVAKLVRLGIVSADQDDRAKKYNAVLSLTERGREMAEETFGMINRAVYAGSSGLTDGDRSVLYRCLETVCANLEHYDVKPE